MKENIFYINYCLLWEIELLEGMVNCDDFLA